MTAATIEIERLGHGQSGPMREVLRLFGQAFDEEKLYSSAPPTDEWLARLLSDDRFVLLAARIDGKVVGALTAYELVKYEQERSELYIYDLAVAEACRRRGIATALIRSLKPIARAKGAWMIFVQADRRDAPAVALYRKLGVEEQPLHFDISPED